MTLATSLLSTSQQIGEYGEGGIRGGGLEVYVLTLLSPNYCQYSIQLDSTIHILRFMYVLKKILENYINLNYLQHA